MSTDTMFTLASMGKMFTNVAAMILFEEGKFLLDDPIWKWLPAFKNPVVRAQRAAPRGRGEYGYVGEVPVVPAIRPITMRHCMTMTVGYIDPGVRGLEPSTTMREFVERMAKMPMEFQPGEGWIYPAGTSILGVIIEIISGQTLEDFMRERIWGPLGMPDTSFMVPEEKRSRLVSLYHNAGWDAEGGWKISRGRPPRPGLRDGEDQRALARPPVRRFSGGGGQATTAGDFARFAQMLLNGGHLDGVRILGRKTVELMTSNQIGSFQPWGEGPGFGYGFGVYVETDFTKASGYGSNGTFGWGGSTAVYSFVDPKEDMLGIYLSQVLGGVRPIVTGEFCRFVYQAVAD